MPSDGVSTAFEIILDEIASVVSEVNSHGAALLRNGEYDRAEETIASGRKLKEFRVKLETLRDEWIAGMDEPTRRKVQVQPSDVSRTINSGPRASKTILVVKFADGSVVFEPKAADTFAKAIAKLGLQRVADLRLRVNNFPLISTERSDIYSQTPIDGHLIMTHSSTEAKREKLLDIAKALNVELTADIVPTNVA